MFLYLIDFKSLSDVAWQIQHFSPLLGIKLNVCWGQRENIQTQKTPGSLQSPEEFSKLLQFRVSVWRYLLSWQEDGPGLRETSLENSNVEEHQVDTTPSPIEETEAEKNEVN